MIGASAGFTLRYVGRFGRFGGSWPTAAAMADWTSRAAPLISRARSNWSAIVVAPRKLTDVISVTPAMRPNWRSSGVATAEAIVSGLAPGRPATTLMVGKSTWGSGATGSSRNEITPAMTSAIVRSVVPTGRRTNGLDRLIARPPGVRRVGAPARGGARGARPDRRTRDR